MNKMSTEVVRCRKCGQLVQASNEGWTTKLFEKGIVGRVTHYFSWLHVRGHLGVTGKRQCPGSGSSPVTANIKR